jgi:hypothetical protein
MSDVNDLKAEAEKLKAEIDGLTKRLRFCENFAE